jgi:hypothetical protein
MARGFEGGRLGAYGCIMSVPLRGRVRGASIELDAALPQLDGQRVLVVVEPLDEEILSVAEQRAVWTEWVARGSDGPIEDDGEPAFP